MIKDKSKYYTIFQPDIKSYLSITIFTASDLVDHLIHEECPNHEEALARSRKWYSVMPDSENGETITTILGICRDATCGCGGKPRMDGWRDGKLYQWHGDDVPSALFVQALVGQEAMEEMQQALRIATGSVPDQGK